MLRRSSRKRNPNNDVSSDIITDITSDEEFTERHKKTRKRQKKSNPSSVQMEGRKNKRAFRGKRGSLSELTEMPLDILYEIFGYLNPVDILHLSRTTKALRAVLMNRSAISVWKRARSNLQGFPNCPNDLSEPQYARLAFDPQCHYCLKANTPTIFWSYRVRCCQRCFYEQDYNLYNISGVFYDIFPTVPGTVQGRRCLKFCLRTAELYKDEYNRLDDAKKGPWLAEKRAYYLSVIEHAKLCAAWHENRMKSRTTELQDARRRRYNAIQQRLVALGWGDEFKNGPLCDLWQHQLVKQPKDLTDRIWDNIKPTLLQVMGRVKYQRLTSERRGALRKRLDILLELYKELVARQPLYTIIPDVGDIAVMERFSTIIEHTPFEEILTKDHFTEAIGELPTLIEGWRREKDDELLAIIKQSIEIDNSALESTLNLASTLFRCRCSNMPITYPRILIHSCCTINGYGDPKHREVINILGYQPWNSRDIVFDYDSHMSARSALEACGYDPNITTTQDVTNANILVECLDHSDFNGRVIMRFHSAITHSSAHRKTLAVLNDEDMKRVAEIEETHYKDYWARNHHKDIWECVRCRAKLSWHEVAYHIRTVHREVNMSATGPVELEDVVLRVDAPPPPVEIKLLNI